MLPSCSLLRTGCFMPKALDHRNSVNDLLMLAAVPPRRDLRSGETGSVVCLLGRRTDAKAQRHGFEPDLTCE